MKKGPNIPNEGSWSDHDTRQLILRLTFAAACGWALWNVLNAPNEQKPAAQKEVKDNVPLNVKK